jgi:hypothetical protein
MYNVSWIGERLVLLPMEIYFFPLKNVNSPLALDTRVELPV